jgi:trimethylamine:corrinoid methyltransferase-like protein
LQRLGKPFTGTGYVLAHHRRVQGKGVSPYKKVLAESEPPQLDVETASALVDFVERRKKETGTLPSD